MTVDAPSRAALEEIIRQRAGAWYPGGAVGEPQLLDHHERPASSLFRYRLGPTGPIVVIKLPRAVHEPAPRPRVRKRYYPDTTRHRAQVGAAALKAADVYFSELADPRLRSLRLLELIEQPDAIVTEFVPWPDLHGLFLRAALRRRVDRRVTRGFANTGLWLKAYHSSPPPPFAGPRDATVSDFLATLDALAGYLTSRLGRDTTVESIVAVTNQRAPRVLPDPLPLVMGHGDLGPANVLVAADGKVAVLDLNGRWLAPEYEDVAAFITAARTTGAAMVSLGLAVSGRVVDEAEGAFLDSYYPAGPPPAVNLFRVNATLDAWGSKLGRFRGWRRRLLNTSFRRQLEALGREL